MQSQAFRVFFLPHSPAMRRPVCQCRRILSWQSAFLMASTLSLSQGWLVTRRVSFTSRSRCTPVSVISQQSHLSKIKKIDLSSLDRRYAHRREEGNENEVRGKPSPRDYIFQRNPPEDYEMLETTMDWVQNVVIGLNLCPFAERR